MTPTTKTIAGAVLAGALVVPTAAGAVQLTGGAQAGAGGASAGAEVAAGADVQTPSAPDADGAVRAAEETIEDAAGMLAPDGGAASHDTTERRVSPQPDKHAHDRRSYEQRSHERRSHDDRPTQRSTPQSEIFPIEDVGAVRVTWTDHRILDVDVRPEPGWRYRVQRHNHREVSVGFTDGQEWVLFHARVTDSGDLETHVRRRERGARHHEESSDGHNDGDNGGDGGSLRDALVDAG